MPQNRRSKNREAFIDEAQNQLQARARGLQSLVRIEALRYLISELGQGSEVTSDRAAFSKIRRLDSIIQPLAQPKIDSLVNWFARKVLTGVSLARLYFGREAIPFESASGNALLAFLGIARSGDDFRAVRGGYMAELVDITEPVSTVKRVAMAAVLNPDVTVTNFRRQVARRIDGGNNRSGLFESRFNRMAGNVFARTDAASSKQMATRLQFRAAIYQGGTITTTRDFCLQRDGQVFTREEIAAWANLEWAGKNEGYNPFSDRGGYNCRHQLDWISDRLAVRLRPELGEVWGM